MSGMIVKDKNKNCLSLFHPGALKKNEQAVHFVWLLFDNACLCCSPALIFALLL